MKLKRIIESEEFWAIFSFLIAITTSVIAGLYLPWTKKKVILASVLLTIMIVVVFFLTRLRARIARSSLSRIISRYKNAGRLLHELTRVKVSDPISKTIEEVAEIEKKHGKQLVYTMTASLSLENFNNDNKLLLSIAANLFWGSTYCYLIPEAIMEHFEQFQKKINRIMLTAKPTEGLKRKQALDRLTYQLVEPLFLPCDMVAYYNGGVLHKAYRYLNKHRGGVLAMEILEDHHKVGAAIDFIRGAEDVE